MTDTIATLRERLASFGCQVSSGIMWRPHGLNRQVELFELAADLLALCDRLSAGAGEQRPIGWTEPSQFDKLPDTFGLFDAIMSPVRTELCTMPIYSAPADGQAALLVGARDVISNLAQFGNFDNGVYGPNGENEGVIRTAGYVSDILAKLDAYLIAAQPGKKL